MQPVQICGTVKSELAPQKKCQRRCRNSFSLQFCWQSIACYFCFILRRIHPSNTNPSLLLFARGGGKEQLKPAFSMRMVQSGQCPPSRPRSKRTYGNLTQPNSYAIVWIKSLNMDPLLLLNDHLETPLRTAAF